MPLKYEYDPGEKREKHKWRKDMAGFLPDGGKNARGKCPSSITHGLARRILQEGVPYPPNVNPPDKIYNVYKGVVYRAEITEPGKSYHGFPEWNVRQVDEKCLTTYWRNWRKAPMKKENFASSGNGLGIPGTVT